VKDSAEVMLAEGDYGVDPVEEILYGERLTTIEKLRRGNPSTR